MPFRYRIDRGFTIAANSTQFWNWGWTGPGQGEPNKGPVIFRAVPKGPGQGGNNTVKNVLITYDFATCRGPQPSPQVFYEFKIKNESSITIPFNLEIVHFADLPISPS
jgi:hypothetical protein